MYKVVNHFIDLCDSCHEYYEGDEYPRSGMVADKTRINELSSTKNRRGIQLIVEVKDEEKATVVGTDEPTIAEPQKKKAKKR